MKQVLSDTGVEPKRIVLEITETTMIRNADEIIPVLEQLKAMGIRLHMDDFGTGYSSLSSLHRFPLTGLKIDKTFVQCVGQRREYAVVIEAIVSLARNLGMTLVAEGIETAEQVAMLQAMDCEKAQGFFFNRPLPAEKARDYIEQMNTRGKRAGAA